MTAARSPPRSEGAHSAWILAQEITVTYPFHPLFGQALVLAGQYQHGGIEHVLVRRKDGATFIFPAWMTANPSLGKIVAHPRLPVNRLIEVREIVDRIMTLLQNYRWVETSRRVWGGVGRDRTRHT